MRRRTQNKQSGTGILDLLEAGVPAGPLSRPNYFYRTGSGSKYHATSDCNRLSSRRHYVGSSSVSVDLTKTADTKFCVDCVTGPTDRTGLRYRDHARRVMAAANGLAVVQKRVLTDHSDDQFAEAEDGTSNGTSNGTSEQLDEPAAPPVELDLSEVTRTSWQRVTEAKSVRHLIASVYEDELVHQEMREYAAETYNAAVALHEHLEHLANAASDRDSVLRSCVVDLLGNLPSNDTAYKITAPVSDPKSYPAVCTVTYGTRATGYKDKVQHAWVAWSDQMKLGGDLAVAREAAMAAGSVHCLEPEHVEQLPKGLARTPAPESGSPWEWLVAEWRLQVDDELAAIIDEWEEAYTAALKVAADEPAQVVGLREWDLSTRTAVNPSTELLARLRLVTDLGKEYALLTVDGPVARWLLEFGTSGIRRSSSSYSYQKKDVEEFGEATPHDSVETFATALRMWEKADANNRRPGQKNPMADLAQVLDIARGIHAADPNQDPDTDSDQESLAIGHAS